MGYRYFIAFIAEDEKGKCDANGIIGFRKKIDSMADIIEIGEDLKTQHNFKKVVITNFIFLGTEEIEEDGDHIPYID